MAKPELRARAEALRRQGLSVPAIAAQLGIARSTAFQWTRHLPREGPAEAAARRRDHSKAMTDARWAEHRSARDSERAATLAAAAAEVGPLTERELLLVGAALYWAEGTKAKPWRPNDWRMTFTNSDPGLARLFLRFLQALGVERTRIGFRLSIHEEADVETAKRWWAQQLGLGPEVPIALSLKRHNPSPQRYNSGEHYQGCIVVRVSRSSRVYWRIEGTITGLLGGE